MYFLLIIYSITNCLIKFSGVKYEQGVIRLDPDDFEKKKIKFCISLKKSTTKKGSLANLSKTMDI